MMLEVTLTEKVSKKLKKAIGLESQSKIEDFVNHAVEKEADYVNGLEDFYNSEHQKTNKC